MIKMAKSTTTPCIVLCDIDDVLKILFESPETKFDIQGHYSKLKRKFISNQTGLVSASRNSWAPKFPSCYISMVIGSSNYTHILHFHQVMTTSIRECCHLTQKIVVKVKFKVTKTKPTCDFLLVPNSNYTHILHFYQVMTT